MKLTMSGTGNALVTECYNTCFIIEDSGQLFMVDGGGGNTILRQIKAAGYDWMDVRHIFVTHKHVDHLMGIIWMVRMICQMIPLLKRRRRMLWNCLKNTGMRFRTFSCRE